MNFILQTLLDVKGTVFSSIITSRRCQHPYSLTHVYAAFFTIYAAFHLFKFRQDEVTGLHDVNVLSFLSNYM